MPTVKFKPFVKLFKGKSSTPKNKQTARGVSGGTQTTEPAEHSAETLAQQAVPTNFEASLLETTTTTTIKEPDVVTTPPLGLDPSLDWNLLEKKTLVGAGTFGQVWLCSRDDNNQTYAVKCQAKRDILLQRQVKAVIREKHILSSLGYNNPFVCHLYNSFQDSTHLYMVMTALMGGELFSLIHTQHKNQNGLPEVAAQFYSANIYEALLFLHHNSILYRDVKPENVMLDQDGYCVLVDFGFARVLSDSEKAFTVCGTPLYLAPEVIINRGYHRSADNWSFGCLVYEMLVGQNPFYSKSISKIQLFKRIVRGDYQIPDWACLGDSAVNLLENLLVVNPLRRLGGGAGEPTNDKSDQDIRNHAWLAEYSSTDLLHKNLEAPWIPQHDSSLQGLNFENWDHVRERLSKRNIAELQLTPSDQARFDEF